MKVSSKTISAQYGEVNLTFLPHNRSHLEDYAQAYYNDGYSQEEIESLVLGLLWSSLFLGEYKWRLGNDTSI